MSAAIAVLCSELPGSANRLLYRYLQCLFVIASSICPRLNMVLDPVLVCISGLWVHMLWAWSLLFTHVDFLMVGWYASCVFVLAAIICAFTPDVGSCLHSYVLNVLVCAVVPQSWMMRRIAPSCVNTRQLLRLEICSCQLLYHLCPRCLLSGMLTFGHCLQLAGSLFQCMLVKYVAICVRVGRQCHQAGGTDVVDLPDILLPEDQYLDMFDVTGHPAWLVLWIVFDLDTPISLLLVICLLVLLFAVSVVGCLLGYSSCLVVWIPLFLDPSDGAFGRFDLAALCGCRTLNFCLFVCLFLYISSPS